MGELVGFCLLNSSNCLISAGSIRFWGLLLVTQSKK